MLVCQRVCYCFFPIDFSAPSNDDLVEDNLDGGGGSGFFFKHPS